MSGIPEIFPVVMAGGKGSRLWPYSNTRTPKQFLKFGTEYSLFQRTLLRMAATFDAPVTIVTTQHSVDQVRNQCREVELAPKVILTEPEAKGTGIAYAVAAAYLRAIDKDAKMVVVPVDGYFEDEKLFSDTISTAAWDLPGNGMGLLGIAPDHPHEGFGYIIPEKLSPERVSGRIASFVEKPEKEVARKLINDNHALWNCGILLSGVERLCQAINTSSPAWFRLAEAAIRGATTDGVAKRLSALVYDMVGEGDFEKAVLLHQSDLVFWRYAGAWSDVGSYGAIGDMIPPDECGNVVIGQAESTDCSDCIVISPDNPVAVVGLRDIIVSVREGRVLVANKDRAQDVGTIGKRLEKRILGGWSTGRKEDWGYANVLKDDAGYRVRELWVAPGESLALQAHDQSRKHWTLAQGSAVIFLDGRQRWLQTGESVTIPVGTAHKLLNPAETPLLLIEVQQGQQLDSESAVLFDDALHMRTPEPTPGSGITQH